MTRAWRLARHASPELRAWDSGFVVHHALSNDTHRLSEPAGLVLLQLMATRGAGDADKEPGQADFGDDLHATLAALAELGFVDPC